MFFFLRLTSTVAHIKFLPQQRLELTLLVPLNHNLYFNLCIINKVFNLSYQVAASRQSHLTRTRFSFWFFSWVVIPTTAWHKLRSFRFLVGYMAIHPQLHCVLIIAWNGIALVNSLGTIWYNLHSNMKCASHLYCTN